KALTFVIPPCDLSVTCYPDIAQKDCCGVAQEPVNIAHDRLVLVHQPSGENSTGDFSGRIADRHRDEHQQAAFFESVWRSLTRTAAFKLNPGCLCKILLRKDFGCERFKRLDGLAGQSIQQQPAYR